MRRAPPFVLLIVSLTGCAPWQTAVIGPTPTHALAMWRGTDVREVDTHRDGRLAPVSWSQALGPGLDATWALVDFHDPADPRTDVFVVEDLRRVDDGARFPQLGPLVERAFVRHAVWVAAHAEDTDAALAPFEGASVQTIAPEVTAMAWSTDRIVLTIRSELHAIRACGEGEVTLGGIAWERTYDVVEDGTVTPISDDQSTATPREGRCEIALP